MQARLVRILIATALAYLACARPAVCAPTYRVLVVMSYEESYEWSQAIKQGLEKRLAASCELHYFYMDTKRNYAGGQRKAEEALALYRRLQPDAVIAADDSAQAFFVVPYLRNKVDTPVIFCGVNAAPAVYGYPATNVTGVLERLNIGGAIAFAQLLIPDLRRVGFLTRAGTTSRGILQQVEAERDTYPATILPVVLVTTLSEARAQLEQLRTVCDTVYVTNVNGLLDHRGRPLPEAQIIPDLADSFGKPLIASRRLYVAQGALLTVANSGAEQGETAAQMLLEHLAGTPLKRLPLRRNRKGSRIINLQRMQALEIQPLPAVLVGAEFVDGSGGTD